MAAIGGLIVLLGGLVSFVGSIMVLIKAFQKSILWGLGSLLIPFVVLVFVFLSWPETKKGFLLMLGGTLAMGLGALLGAMFADTVAPPQV